MENWHGLLIYSTYMPIQWSSNFTLKYIDRDRVRDRKRERERENERDRKRERDLWQEIGFCDRGSWLSKSKILRAGCQKGQAGTLGHDH